MLRPTIWLWDNSGSAYVDLTDNVKTDSDFTLLSDANDRIYLGLNRRFVGIYSDLTTNGSYTGLSYNYIKSGETWTGLSLIDSYAFASSKYLRWVLPQDWIKFNFTSTSPHVGAPPDSVERYWTRIACTAITTAAVVDKLRLIPFVTYTNPTKVSELLQFKKDFDYSTKPSDLTVEDIIRRIEDRIDYRTRKSWRFNVVVEETDPKLVDFNRYGMYLRHRNFLKIYSVELWNGAAWNALTIGRSNDYFVNYDLGVIYMTRMFLLPAMYGMMGRYTQYTYGEFKNAVRVDYAYGRNQETDSEFYMVEDIATKMAAVDVIRHHDYSSMVVSGSDKIPLEMKVRNLEEEIEARLDELTGIAVV